MRIPEPVWKLGKKKDGKRGLERYISMVACLVISLSSRPPAKPEPAIHHDVMLTNGLTKIARYNVQEDRVAFIKAQDSEMYTEDRYEKLFDDRSRYPHVVGVTGPFGFCTGILISDHFVLTCAHIFEGQFYEELSAYLNVITSKGAMNGLPKFVDHRCDLTLVELADPVLCSKLNFADDNLKPGMFVVAAGVQERPGHPDQLVIAETEMKCLTINSWNGGILDIQLDGGVRHGYSGGPVFIQQENACFVGLVSAGGGHASTTFVTGLARIRVFVNKHLPSCT